MNKNKSTHKFEFVFFIFSVILIALVGLRFGGLNPLNIAICTLLIILAPFLTKLLGKKYGTEAAAQIKMEKIDEISEDDLASRIRALYTGRGFALETYESDFPGRHYVCTRNGTRNGESFTERGAVLIIATEDIIDMNIFNHFLLEMKQRACTQGMIVTTSRFSPEVIDAAKDNLITLWNRENLRDSLNL